MFATTFLGHQGWAFQSESACILVDPLLCEEFGHAQALEYRVFPPRIFTHAAIPPLDAVILTHEHDDHFDIPSLALLDRAIPIYLSARSSIAARQLLHAMGFTVHPLIPGSATRFGELEIVPFAGDHVTVNCGDEWDTLPFLVRHTGGAGSLFSMVDITLTQTHVEWVAAKAMRPGLVSWTNNALDWSHMADFLTERDQGTQQCFVNMGMGHKLIEQLWGTPAAMLMCANGFSFRGASTWLDDHVFCVDMDAVCAMMSKVYRKEKFIHARPGQTWVMQANKLTAIEPRTPWLTTAPPETWPSRVRTAKSAIPDYRPATGRTTPGDGDLERLRSALDELAGALVGGPVFRGLCSLLATETDRTPTFAFRLRTGDAGDRSLVFAYELTECRFVDVSETPAAYLAEFECWATDLLAVLRGELGPIALTFGRARLRNALPQRFHFDIFGELNRVSHPLRRPAESARTYERLWQQCQESVPVITRRNQRR